MSGFAGFLDATGLAPDSARTAAIMAGADQCAWSDQSAGIAIAGCPVAHSHDGRWVVALAGTIRDRDDLRRRLAPCEWRGPSDAETVAEAVARWGVERGLQAVGGAFAAMVWNRVDRTLHLARDRFGERSLAWARSGGVVMFATDLAALRRHPGFDRALDPQAVTAFLRLGFVPAPLSIHGAARKLAPGTVLTVKGGAETAHPVWSAPERMRALAGSFPGGPAAAAERLNLLLRASLAPMLDHARPVAVLLSGGPASALVAAIARELAGGTIHTITLAESGDPATRLIADHLGTDHREVAVSDADAVALMPGLARLWDEPFAHPGQLAACLLARAAASAGAAGVLTGEGAAPLFGAALHGDVARDWTRLGEPPSWRRRLGGWADTLRGRHSDPTARSPAELLWRRRALGPGPLPPLASAGLADPAQDAMAADLLVTLPESTCVLSGRAAAAAGIEAGRPFLDAPLAECAWSLSAALKVDGGMGQACLREVLCRYLPELPQDTVALGDRLPLARWLAGPLAEWAGDLLAEDHVRRHGLIDPAALARCRREGRTGEIWAMLMAQAWMDQSTP